MPKNADADTMTADTAVSTAAEVTATFKFKARTNLRGDGAPQKSYNILLLDEASKANVIRLGESQGFDPVDANGDIWVEVSANPRSIGIMRKAGTKIVVEGTLTIVDTVTSLAGRVSLQGDIVVAAARQATLLDGGRMKFASESGAQARANYANRG